MSHQPKAILPLPLFFPLFVPDLVMKWVEFPKAEIMTGIKQSQESHFSWTVIHVESGLWLLFEGDGFYSS